MWPVSGSATILSLHIILLVISLALVCRLVKKAINSNCCITKLRHLDHGWNCVFEDYWHVYILVFYVEQVLTFRTFFVSLCICLVNWRLLWCLVNLLLLVIWVWFPPRIGVDLQAFLLYKCRVYTFLALVWHKCRNNLLFNFCTKYVVMSRFRLVWQGRTLADLCRASIIFVFLFPCIALHD